MVAKSVVFSYRTFKFGLLVKLKFIGSIQTSLKDFQVQDHIFEAIH